MSGEPEPPAHLARRAAVAGKPRYPHRPLLSVSQLPDRAQLIELASAGGNIDFAVTNAGAAMSQRPVLELLAVRFPLRGPPPGSRVYIWNLTDTGVGSWRHPMVDELVAPDQVVSIKAPGRPLVTLEDGTAEQFIDPAVQPGLGSPARTTRIATQLGSLAPGATAVGSVSLAGVPAGAAGDGLASWCLLFCCYDILLDPRPPITLPTPAQPAHHRQLLCLHDL